MKEKILTTSRNLIRKNGFDHFSYRDLSNIIGIKTSSIHYHFPTKIDLAVELIKKEQLILNNYKGNIIDLFVNVYEEESFCVCGILAIRSIDERVRVELDLFFEHIQSMIEQEGYQDAFQLISFLEGSLLVARARKMSTYEYRTYLEIFMKKHNK